MPLTSFRRSELLGAEISLCETVPFCEIHCRRAKIFYADYGIQSIIEFDIGLIAEYQLGVWFLAFHLFYSQAIGFAPGELIDDVPV